MNNSKPEEAMTFGELLTLIHQQQQRLQVLESSFSQLITLLSPGLQQQLVSYLSVRPEFWKTNLICRNNMPILPLISRTARCQTVQ